MLIKHCLYTGQKLHVPCLSNIYPQDKLRQEGQMEPSTYKLLLTALNDYEATVRSKYSLFAHVHTYIHMYFIFLFFLQLERNHSQLPNTGDEVHCLMSQAN